ncbi:DUF58 domain-containing protein [Uliginosibacterium paludis]|uniref:DUF58 domain-containing protein n=1 Tax=Uliginosibacterium paludis TaxID=1615952 RepID=A0ABV2CVU6_9RHOO
MTLLPSRVRQRLRRWALRNRAPERQPVRLGQRRVYVLPSRAGLALLLTLLAMLIASINYNLSLGYGLVFLLGSVFVLHILHSWRTLTNLEVSIAAHGESFAGGAASWRLTARNAARSERPGLRLKSAAGQILYEHFDVPANAQAELLFALPARARGLMQPGQLTLETTQPLGWIRAWSYLEPDAQAVVYPAPAGTRALPAGLSPAQSGQNASLVAGQDDFAGLRKHQPVDSPRHIAWKQLAQGRGLLTKTWASAAARECVLDWRLLPAEQSLETRLSQLTAWVLEARAAGMRTTLILPDSETGPGEDAAHHQVCLLRLALCAGGGRP